MRATEPRRSRETAWAIGFAVVLHGLLLLAWQGPSNPTPSQPQAAPIVMQARWIAETPAASPPAPLNRSSRTTRTTAHRPPATATITSAAQAAERTGALSMPALAPARAEPPQAAPESAPQTRPQALRLSPEALANSLQRERRWQQQHGDGHRFPDRFAAPGPSQAPGTTSLQESDHGNGGRLARVQGPLGTYCVRLPPPDRPLPDGPAPRLALPSNCP